MKSYYRVMLGWESTYTDFMTQQTITKIADTFDINKIYARHLFHIADKHNMFDSIAKIIDEKPKPFVKWIEGKIYGN